MFSFQMLARGYSSSIVSRLWYTAADTASFSPIIVPFEILLKLKLLLVTVPATFAVKCFYSSHAVWTFVPEVCPINARASSPTSSANLAFCSLFASSVWFAVFLLSGSSRISEANSLFIGMLHNQRFYPIWLIIIRLTYNNTASTPCFLHLRLLCL